MRLIITRHGETIENRNHIIQGHLPGRLSREGKRQAKLLGERLSHVRIDAIYSSDLARAKDTASEIAKHHPGIPVHYTRRLREFHMGDWTGKRILNRKHNDIPPKGESHQRSYTRAKKLIDKVIADHSAHTVLFVGHGGFKRALVAAILQKGPEYIGSLGQFRNTAVTIIRIEKGKARVVTRNCTKHLA